MNKIINDNKARAIPIVAILIVGILVVAGIYVYLNPELVGAEEYWETPTGFGMWQDELIVTFADGTTESLKTIQDKPFTVVYDDKEIIDIELKLTAKATGSVYTGAEIKTEDGFGYQCALRNVAHPTVVLISGSNQKGDGWTTQISMDSTYTVLQGGLGLKGLTDNDPGRYPTGIYRIDFAPKGKVWYRGYPDGGDWVLASLPPTRSATFVVQQPPSGSISITLGSSTVT